MFGKRTVPPEMTRPVLQAELVRGGDPRAGNTLYSGDAGASPAKAGEADGDERRASRRNRVLKRGLITFNNGFSVIECAVRNQSSGGALLALGDTNGIPNRFMLQIGDDEPRPARLRWRTPVAAGVSFE